MKRGRVIFAGRARGPRRLGWLAGALLVSVLRLTAADDWVHDHGAPGDFSLVWEGNTADLVLSADDSKVVGLALNDLAADIERVTGLKPRVAFEPSRGSRRVVIAGTLGKNPLIDALVASGRLDVGAVRGEWETFLIATVDMPPDLFAGGGPPAGAGTPAQALVIVGSDRRGTAFGIYELSRAIGVSPWYWWADVTPERKSELHVVAGTRRFGPPSVQYRGIFINDEDWGLQPWAAKTFAPEDGDIGPKTYAKVFELLLRLKANTLWPAMHKVTRPFNDFPANAPLADDYAIVMGSSHAEPMLRNNVGEWTAPAEQYNYVANRTGVLGYWEERVAANGRYENIFTVGMRGIHDSNMVGPKSDAERIRTLEQIFADQRELLARHVTPAVEQVPQMFCAYKEVLELYRQGLRVPDDVTIVWPDDNFGYVRNFASAEERKRSGGFGVYYHLSYLGRPLSYLWLGTTPPALIWSEMSKAYDHGAQRIWIANVGDLKPAEITTEFFLQMAWDVRRWHRDNLPEFLREWAGREFGPADAGEIAGIMETYYRLNFQRKPEHLQWWLPRTPPQPSPLSATEVVERLAAFAGLVGRVDRVEAALPAEKRDAFFELVGYPVRGSALANTRYFSGEQAALAGGDAALAQAARAADAQLRNETRRFNEDIADGKWRHLMALEPADDDWKSMRIAAWELPAFVRPPGAPPPVASRGATAAQPPAGFSGFVERSGVVAINAIGALARPSPTGAAWQPVPGLGRSVDVMSVFPTTQPRVAIEHAQRDAPQLEFTIWLASAGEFPVQLHLLPTHPLDGGGDLRVAIALDDEPVRPVSLAVDDGGRGWAQGVLDSNRVAGTTIRVNAPGRHTLRIFGTDPGVMLEKIVIDCGGLTPSYLGPKATLSATGK